MGEKFTDNIPNILTQVGFDTKSAIKTLSNQTITSIENYINDNRDLFQEFFTGTRYENVAQFKFLPGHCAVILSLPKYIETLTTKNRGKKRKHCEISDHPQSSTTSSTTDHPGADSAVNSVGDGVDKIKTKLINKIKHFATKKNLNIEIDESSILNFRFENDSYKCAVKCSVCDKVVPCTFVKHWVCGNFETHIKKHSDQIVEEYLVEDDNSIQLFGNSRPTISRISNTQHLQQYINSN